MKKLDSNKLTQEQQDLFKNHLAYLATVNKDGTPLVGPKGSMHVLDESHLQYLEKTQAHAYKNLEDGSKVAVVVADFDSHKAVRVRGTAHIHEHDDYAKKIVEGTDTPNAFVVNIDIDEIDA